MAAARPFAAADDMAAEADAAWARLGREDWLEAFAAHPRIGERAGEAGGAGRAGRAGGTGKAGGAGAAEGAGESRTAEWSAHEQSGVTDASRNRFVQLNREYEERFGFIFIVCAAGKSATEMLDILARRMRNNPDAELEEAAEQQRQITRLRLRKLLDH